MVGELCLQRRLGQGLPHASQQPAGPTSLTPLPSSRARRGHWLDTTSDELLAQLRVLNGFDIDMPADLTRLTNRLRELEELGSHEPGRDDVRLVEQQERAYEVLIGHWQPQPPHAKD